MSCSKVWMDTTESNTADLILFPSGKSENCIVFHIRCTDNELLPGCLHLFREAKSNEWSDHYTEMNWELF